MERESQLVFVVLRCADLDRARDFYAALGLRLVMEKHGAGATHYSATLGDTVLELYPLQNEPTSGLRIGLRVEDPERVAAAVAAAGGTVVRTSTVEVVVRDPDGHTIHLVAR